MSAADSFSQAAIVGAVVVALGWWLKSKLENSIKHEYDKLLEEFKGASKRTDILLAERLAAFKLLSARLIALRRFCEARSAEMGNSSEFAPRTDSLTESENLGLLEHWDVIRRGLEDNEFLFSPKARDTFSNLFEVLGFGVNAQLWTDGGTLQGVVDDISNVYDAIGKRVNESLSALYADLGLPQNTPV